jgi:hypothetical protein
VLDPGPPPQLPRRPFPGLRGVFRAASRLARKSPTTFAGGGSGQQSTKFAELLDRREFGFAHAGELAELRAGLELIPIHFVGVAAHLSSMTCTSRARTMPRTRRRVRPKKGYIAACRAGGNRARDGCPGLGQVDAPDARNGNGDEKLIN